MSLTNAQYQDFMNEYDRIRRENEQLRQSRIDEVYSLVPEIEAIDHDIAAQSLTAAREKLFKPDSHPEGELHQRIAACVSKKRELLIRNHFPVDYLETVYTCPTCQDRGYIGSRKCICFEQKIRNLLCHQSNLEEEIREHNFDSFRIEYYSDEVPAGMTLSPRENMLKVLDTSRKFIVDLESSPGKNLLIYGKTGRGKTFLSTCIAAEAIRRNYSVIYMTSYQLFEQLSDYTFRHESTDPRPLLMDVDLLIIDDLGAEMNNSFTNSQLFLCINERILHKKSTIINTNLSPSQLKSMYTDRISSRLIQFYTVLNLYGEDIRYKKTFSPID